MSKFKIGDIVRIVSNKSRSSHSVGSTGRVVVREHTEPDRETAYLIDANGYCDDCSTWSYESDLKALIGKLNPKTKVI